MLKDQTDFFDEDQNGRHYSAIGRVAALWTRLRRNIYQTIWMLAGVDSNTGECLTNQAATIGELVNSLFGLSELRRPGITKELEFHRNLGTLESLEQRQHEVIHDLWTFDQGTTILWPLRLRGTSQNSPREMSTAEVEQLGTEIAKYSMRFLDFRRVLLMSLSLWQGQ